MNMVSVSANGLHGDWILPDGHGPYPAVVMLGGSEGGRMWSRIRPVLGHLTRRGFAVLSLAYFKEHGLPPSLEEIPLEYFLHAFDWLDKQPDVLPGSYAVIGASKGGEAALLAASREPRIKVVVAFNPSSVVWQGIPHNRFMIADPPKSSWSFAGKGLPYVPSSLTRANLFSLLTLRLRSSAERDLQNTEVVKRAAIPLERGKCAVMLISGSKDQLWPSTWMCEQIMARLAAAAYPHPFQHLAVEKGHNSLIRDRACWRQAFQFMDRHFIKSPANP